METADDDERLLFDRAHLQLFFFESQILRDLRSVLRLLWLLRRLDFSLGWRVLIKVNVLIESARWVSRTDVGQKIKNCVSSHCDRATISNNDQFEVSDQIRIVAAKVWSNMIYSWWVINEQHSDIYRNPTHPFRFRSIENRYIVEIVVVRISRQSFAINQPHQIATLIQ